MTPVEILIRQGQKPEEELGFIPLLVLPIKAGIKFLRSPKGRELVAKIRSRRQAALAAQQAAAPGTEAAAAAAAEIERLTVLENQARAGKVSEADVDAILPVLVAPVSAVPVVTAPVVAPVRADGAAEKDDDREGEGREGESEGEDALGRMQGRLRPGQRRSPLDKEQVDRYLANGTGGLSFRATSPAGLGRLCRMQFYPAQNKDAVSAVFNTVLGFRILVASGIDEPGDDPIANLAIQGLNVLSPLPTSFLSQQVPLVVPQIDYGVYRVLGLQTHEWAVSFEPTADLSGTVGIVQPVVTVGSLRTQNGRKLFVTDTQGLPASTFAILPYNSSLGGISSGGFPFDAAPVKASVWQQRRSRFFSGLRDNPVIEQTNSVSMFAQAMLNLIPDAPFPNRMVIPFSADLVVEMLEDDVYGDPIVPSVSARAGAQTRLSLRPIGRDREDRSDILVTSPRYIPRGR